MKITLGTKDLEKIVKDYARMSYPGKDINITITNKRNGVEIVVDLEEPEVSEIEDSYEQVTNMPDEEEVYENIDDNQEEDSNF